MAEHHSTSQQQLDYGLMGRVAITLPAGGTLLVLSGLTMVGSLIGLVVSTPLFMIFSPVLVPAVIIIILLVSGFVASVLFGLAAISVLSWIYPYITWIYSYVTKKHPQGTEQLDAKTEKPMGKAKAMRPIIEEEY